MIRSSASVIALSSMLFGGVAWAQTSTPGDAPAQSAEAASGPVGLEDIVVTAQRRSERLQDVPIAVTALSANTLAQKGIVGTADLNAVVPGLVLTKSTFSVQPFLRGVGNSSIQPSSDPSVAVYVDGVYQMAANGLLFDFNNVDRIEVLRGPQGTLFGRNATGGLIQIVTRDPGPRFKAEANAQYGNFNTVKLTGYLSGGSDILSADLAVLYKKQGDGWGKNRFTPSQGTVTGQDFVTVGGKQVAIPAVPSDVGTAEQYAVRSKVILRPTDNFEAKISGYFLRTESDQGQYRHGLYGHPQQKNTPGIVTPYIYTGGFYDTNIATPFYTLSQQYGFTGDLSYDAGFATIKSITSYQHSDHRAVTQSSVQPTLDSYAGTGDATILTKGYSEELQLLSNRKTGFTWLLGLYLTDIKSGYLPLVFYRGQLLDNDQPIQGGTNRISSADTLSKAVFGQATIDLWTDGRLTVGGRYTSDRIRAKQYYIGTDITAVPGTASYTGVLSGVVPTQEVKQSKFTWRVALDQHITPDVLAYASVNTGYKAGGYNVGTLCLGTTPVGDCPAAQYAPPVKPETLTSYEAGIKSELFDRRVRLNVAGFYYDYKNLQVQTLFTNALNQLIARLDNAASARNYGVDIDAQAQLADGLNVTLGGEYLHAEYLSFPSASVSVPTAATAASGGNATAVIDASGRPLNRAPKFTLNAGITYSVPTPLGEATFNGTIYHTSSFFWETSLRLKQEAYELVNVSAALKLTDQWSVQAWSRNLFGKEYYSYQSATALGDQGAPAEPRTFGLTVSWKN